MLNLTRNRIWFFVQHSAKVQKYEIYIRGKNKMTIIYCSNKQKPLRILIRILWKIFIEVLYDYILWMLVNFLIGQKLLVYEKAKITTNKKRNQKIKQLKNKQKKNEKANNTKNKKKCKTRISILCSEFWFKSFNCLFAIEKKKIPREIDKQDKEQQNKLTKNLLTSIAVTNLGLET